MYDFSSKEEQLPSSFKNITLQKDTNYIFYYFFIIYFFIIYFFIIYFFIIYFCIIVVYYCRHSEAEEADKSSEAEEADKSSEAEEAEEAEEADKSSEAEEREVFLIAYTEHMRIHIQII